MKDLVDRFAEDLSLEIAVTRHRASIIYYCSDYRSEPLQQPLGRQDPVLLRLPLLPGHDAEGEGGGQDLASSLQFRKV